jgi:hypothetical protein
MSCWPRAIPVPCPKCNGDAGWEGPPSRWSTDGIGPWYRCDACEGTGEIEEEPEGIADADELDDACPPQGETA